jgi:hypothetical protein
VAECGWHFTLQGTEEVTPGSDRRIGRSCTADEDDGGGEGVGA